MEPTKTPSFADGSGRRRPRLLTVDRARELLSYDPETGVLTWRVNRAGRPMAGRVAGGIKSGGRTAYRVIQADRILYHAHRIAWLLHYGAWPTDEIDHINGDGLDNRLANLRAATPSINMRNKPRALNNTSGVTGVYWSRKRRKWRALIQVDGALTHLGVFAAFPEAVAARKAAEHLLGFHLNHGRAIGRMR